jgi:serine/threonine protein kinase
MSAMKNARDIFLSALDCPPADRAAYLDAACEGDDALRHRVEALLRADAQSGAFLSEATPGVPPMDGLTAEPPTATFGDSSATADFPGKDEHLGAILGGKYKLVEEIGEGGMGSVFMAQQAEPVKRAVAVKVIKAGMDSKAVLARFEAERQALAMMDHPNIAKVLDAGTTEGGRPFFVMELVKGTPITQFCDERKLTPRQRLELFVPVCNAIQHAHQKGVIHRDIKPSNVLVAMYDDVPVPKVIDFGVAKAAGQTLTDKTLMTGFGAVIGTPEYMSPEQANLNNLDIDTRSDVYSLGVLLYELLTGTTPVDRKSLGKAALLEILRVVREVEAPRPSAKLSTIDTLPSVAANRGTEPAKLSKLMEGELDWVLLKALEKDRTRRYDTANGLARDIQRYLADELVEARPPSTGYRMRKFVRRHKGQVLAASLVFLALLAGIAGTTWGLIRAESARQNEELARQKAQDERDEKALALAAESKARATARQALDAMTSRIMDDYLARQGVLPESGRRMLTDALRMYEEFALEKSQDLTGQESVVRAQYRVASILWRLGRGSEAIPAFDRAIEGWGRLIAASPANADWRTEALRAKYLRLRSLPPLHEKFAEIESGMLSETDRLIQDFPGYLPARDLELEILSDFVSRKGESLRYQECLAFISRGLAAADLLLARRPDDHGVALRRVKLQQDSGVYRSRAGISPGQTIEENGQLIAAYEKIAQALPGNLEALEAAARCRMNQGIYYRNNRDYDRANHEFRRAEDAIAKLISEFPGLPAPRVMLGQTYLNWGRSLRYEKSPESHLIAALAHATWAGLVRTHSGHLGMLGGLGSAEMLLAELDLDAGKLMAVKERTDRLLSQYDVTQDRNPAEYWTWHDGGVLFAIRAEMFSRLAQFENAAHEWRKSSICERKLSPKNFRSLLRVWVCLARAGKPEIALAEFRQMIPGGIQNPDLTAYDCFNAACVFALASERLPSEKQSHADQAVAYLSRALKGGFQDVVALETDVGLNAIRTRVDFRKLLAETKKDWDQAIALSDPDEKRRLRAVRSNSWIQSGKHAEAVAEVAELTKSDNWTAGQWYDFACVYAVSSGKIAGKTREYGDRALELLKKSVEAGWKDAAHIKKDPDLDSLRERDDFRKLVAELEKKFLPPAKN